MKADKPFTIKEVKRLKIAFPENSDDFFALLIDTIVADGFTKEETVQIIDNAIRTITRQKLTIAEIIYEYKKEKQSHVYD
jgi:hypothetical protein